MPSLSPLTQSLTLSTACIREAELLSNHQGAAAVEYLVFRYGALLAELRQRSRRCAQLDEEGRELDTRLAALQKAAQAVLDL